MSTGNPIAPPILRGAFITFEQNPLGLGGSVLDYIPLFIPFRLNPTELSRSISATYAQPSASVSSATAASAAQGSASGAAGGAASASPAPAASTSAGGGNAAQPTGNGDQLGIVAGLQFRGRTETLTFDLVLDATDRMEAGEWEAPGLGPIGVLPELSALEMLTQPKFPLATMGSLISGATQPPAAAGGSPPANLLGTLLPPHALLVWGYFRMMPCIVTNLSIKEQIYSPALVPIRVQASVTCKILQIWELGRSLQNWLGFGYTEGVKRLMAVLSYRDIAAMANTVVPM